MGDGRLRNVAGHWLVTAGSLALLLLAGHIGGRVSALPPLSRPHDFSSWWERVGAAEATFAAARLVLVVVAVYWLGMLTLVAVARLQASPRLVASLSRSRLLGARRAISIALGASNLGLALAAWAQAPSAPAPPPPPVLTNLGPVAPPSHAGHTPRPAVAPEERPTTSPARRRPPPRPPRSTWADPARRYAIEAGDNLWSISERTLAKAWGRQPTDVEIGRYWTVVIARNQSVLPDPSDPSLVFPGDVVVLPIPPQVP
jgi:nucleoid-associated protein YgaU